MNDDEYPRVQWDAQDGPTAESWIDGRDGGTHKVVPADAIVIERGEIKAVGPADVGRYGLRAGSLTVAHDVTAAEAWASAMEHLAIYLCLRDRPPVDEREVEALAEIVRREETERQNAGDRASWADIARRLLITGCVHVDTEAVDRD